MKLKSTARRGIGRRAVLAAASTLAFPAIRAQAQTAGVALVIGNSRYQWEAPLPNVRRDAPDIAKRFQALGLRTELVQDAGRDAMRQAIDKFMAASRGANFAAFYFAGHGATWGKSTYIVPLDADLGNPGAVANLIAVPAIRTGMEAANARLMVFDNCRNNPADGWRQREAADQAGAFDETLAGGAPNTLVLYSTAPGRVALDGPAGENSPFAATLLRALDGQSVDLQALPGKLRRDLLIATEGRQILWNLSSYQQPFLLQGAPGKTAAARFGWANDPSRIIELSNANAYAAQNGLILPEGLIAHRPPASSPHGQKVGSFKFDIPQPGLGIVPSLIVVVSVEEQESAEVVLMTRRSGRAGWRFLRSTLSGDTLNSATRDNGARFEFKWSNASGGGLTLYPPEHQGGRAESPYGGRFTRLDG